MKEKNSLAKEITEERKTVYRLAPCPAYRMETMESWLEDLAEEGLFLSADGFFCGVGFFYREEPKKVKYRLQAGKMPSGFLNDNDTPEEEEQELSAALGWEYVARRGEFYIYRSMRENVREMNTDPEVQAMTMKMLQKRQVSAIMQAALWCIIYGVLQWSKKAVILPVLYFKTWFYLFSVLLLLWMAGKDICKVVYYGKVRRKLKNGEEPDRNVPWRKKAWLYPAKLVLATIAVVAWICIVLQNIPNDVLFEQEIKIQEYSGNPPFATMEDFNPGKPHAFSGNAFEFYNKVIVWEDILAPVNYIWREQAEVLLSPDQLLDGVLLVDYHELRFEWMAKLLAFDYYRADQGRHFKFISNPEHGLDFAVYYRDEIGWPNVVLREENKVLHASFHEYGSTNYISPEEWIGILADSIREEDQLR